MACSLSLWPRSAAVPGRTDRRRAAAADALGDRPAGPAARRVGSGYARRTRPHQGPGPADALRARLRRRRARAATVGSGRRRCVGDDRARGRQCRPVRLGDRPLPARRRRLDRGRDPDRLRDRCPPRRQLPGTPPWCRDSRPARRPDRRPGLAGLVRVHVPRPDPAGHRALAPVGGLDRGAVRRWRRRHPVERRPGRR